ncbi:TCF3 fusion partner [Nothobranchius furzeri]|uniref:TCF3 (E2A) fusion partner (In childhood Leukemia) n=1 Tax=Nothobranchius furzeri TaxID=105023 RepID=A0A1A8AQZ1_NOTFU|nr:TCF3 fusion partner [Nothobranchius furzeri]KAF7227133.1 TCF3 (E2A) fusion partner (in childhood Leukemia) [Nothobranchius furzeri]
MMEDFSGLALPPLFGGHILEAELEAGGVELGPGEVELGPGGNELLENTAEDDEERRALDKRKYLALSRRCKEIEQVNQKILARLHQVQRITRRLKKERRFLMKTLDAHGDDYRNSQLTVLLEDEAGVHLDPSAGVEDERLNGVSGSSAAGPKKKRHRIPRQEKDRDQQIEPEVSVLPETPFGEMPSPTSLSH